MNGNKNNNIVVLKEETDPEIGRRAIVLAEIKNLNREIVWLERENEFIDSLVTRYDERQAAKSARAKSRQLYLS